MSGRPQLAPGTYGEISCAHVGPSRYRARARFRDIDGRTRIVERTGQTKAEATKRLRAALVDRRWVAEHGDITPNTTVAELATAWLESDAVTGLATNSRAAYKSVVDNHVKPRLGGVRLSELGPSLVNRALTSIRSASGPGAAKTTKNVLSGMCGLAVSHEAITVNPMREAVRIKGSGRRKPRRALTVADETELCDKLRTDQAAIDYDLPDLIDWMLGTGCRIGEALAARDGVNIDGEPLLDLDAGTWEVNATLIRVKGGGLIVQERTKSDAGWRRIALPAELVELVKGRRQRLAFRPDVPVLFPSPRAKALRDPRNTARDWREVRQRLGYEWVNFHKFRATVASRLLAAGVDPARVADHMGHARASMTLDYYAGRSVGCADAATVLSRH